MHSKPSRLIPFTLTILLACPLLMVHGDNSPLSKHPYWNILKEFGGQGKKRDEKAYNVIEEFIRYTKAELYNIELSKRAKKHARRMDQNLATFDLADLYQSMVYRHSKSKWKGNHHFGILKNGQIEVDMADPEIEKWLQMSSRHEEAPWKGISKLGDFDERFYARPVPSTDGEDHYEAYYFHRAGLGLIQPNLIVTAMKQLLSYIERGVRKAPAGFSPSPKLKGQFPKLTNGELFVMRQFAVDMPKLNAKTMRYIDVQSLSTPLIHKGVGYSKFNMKLSLKLPSIKRDFPNIYKYLKKVRGLFDIRSRMYSKGKFVGKIFFSTTNFTFHFTFCMKNGRFLRCIVPWEPEDFKGFGALDVGSQKHEFRNDIVFRVNGLRVILRNLKFDETYTHTKDESSMHFKMTSAPIIQKIDGKAYGMVPVWLIDLLIPSNVEQLLKDFFGVLVKGRKGRSWAVRVRVKNEKGKNRYEFSLASEMLSNGVIRMGFKIVQDILKPDDAAKGELVDFGKIFWHAFVSDYFNHRYEE